MMFTVYCWIFPTKPQMFPTRPFLTSGRSAGCVIAENGEIGGIWGTMPQAAHCIWGRPTCQIQIWCCHGAGCWPIFTGLQTATGRPQFGPVQLGWPRLTSFSHQIREVFSHQGALRRVASGSSAHRIGLPEFENSSGPGGPGGPGKSTTPSKQRLGGALGTRWSSKGPEGPSSVMVSLVSS